MKLCHDCHLYIHHHTNICYMCIYQHSNTYLHVCQHSDIYVSCMFTNTQTYVICTPTNIQIYVICTPTNTQIYVFCTSTNTQIYVICTPTNTQIYVICIYVIFTSLKCMLNVIAGSCNVSIAAQHKNECISNDCASQSAGCNEKPMYPICTSCPSHPHCFRWRENWHVL